MIKVINKYKQVFTIVGAISVLVICYLQQKELTKLRNEPKVQFLESGDISKNQTIDSLQYLVDSLNAEMFPIEIELSRYEMAFRLFSERNPKAAEQYADIISNETE
jgi:hypothetical protein